jgi:hypothetical protein
MRLDCVSCRATCDRTEYEYENERAKSELGEIEREREREQAQRVVGVILWPFLRTHVQVNSTVRRIRFFDLIHKEIDLSYSGVIHETAHCGAQVYLMVLKALRRYVIRRYPRSIFNIISVRLNLAKCLQYLCKNCYNSSPMRSIIIVSNAFYYFW